MKLPAKLIFSGLLTVSILCSPSVALAADEGSPAAGLVKAKFDLCLSDAIIGLHLGRDYLYFKKTKQYVTETAQSSGEATVNLANKLFAGTESGSLKNHFQFAQESLFSCMNERHLPLEDEISKEMAQACFYQSDIIFFGFAARFAGKTKEEAQAKVEKILKLRNLASSELIAGVVNQIYSGPNTEDAQGEGFRSFLKSCIVSLGKK